MVPTPTEAPPSEFFLRDLPLYLDHLAVEKGLARNSLEAYRRDLTTFGRHLDEAGLFASDVTRDDVVRWFGDDGVHEAPLTPELRAAATRDELDLFHRIGSRDVVRLHRHSPWPRLLGGVALACGTVGVIAVIVQIAAMILAG